MLGALVGDAAGAVLEFFRGEIGEADVQHALQLPGGGVWKVAPGQITDDGELTMSLLRALASSPGAAVAPVAKAAEAYAAWVASDPFDIGATTVRSLGCLRDPVWAARAQAAGTHVAMTEAARERCMGSKANGSLMRATPLGVWGATRSDDSLVAAAMADSRLSHPNPACVDAVVAYTLAIATLIRLAGDTDRASRAVGAARAWTAANACTEVRDWLEAAIAGEPAAYTPSDGFVRIGFMHAFRHLAAGTSYVEALRETLAGGGDTDTNACIVGGLLGARDGANALPHAMRERVLGCDTKTGANPRPEELHPRAVPALVAALLS